MHYDLIGDIHGHAHELEALLARLGYRERGGVWRQAGRMVIFVGDFIDRGPRQLDSVLIPRRMIDAGQALAVMGNHEFNAIAWHTPDPDAPGEFLRPHHSPRYGDKNRRQHAAFLAAVEHRPELHRECVDWFLTLPLWLDLPELRVVHAAWHPRFMDFLRPLLAPGKRLTRELMPEATREPADEADKDRPEPSVFKAVDALTKGIEMPLPAPHGFRDKDGIERHRTRVRWWDPQALTCRRAALLTEAQARGLPDAPVPEHFRIGYDGTTPVFVGHYWLSGPPRPLAPRVACVDYSAGKGAPLVAYRWEGEEVLEPGRFVASR